MKQNHFPKIKAILSRCEGETEEAKPRYIQIGQYLFNTELRTISKNEEVIKLTPKESHLLELLYKYRDHLLLISRNPEPCILSIFIFSSSLKYFLSFVIYTSILLAVK